MINGLLAAVEEVSGGYAFLGMVGIFGAVCMLRWTVRTSLGTEALTGVPIRRTKLPVWLAFLPMVVWLMGVSGAAQLVGTLWPGLEGASKVFADHVIFAVASVAAIFVVLVIARNTFARRLRGFGLNFRSAGVDFVAAVLNLVSIYPVIWVVVEVTMLAGQLIWPGFEMQPHQELETIASYSQWSLRAVIMVTTIVLVPACEELLFRGLLQSVIRSYVKGPWIAITLGSMIFAAAHYDPMHWPALFVLSMCIGYSYEKSGSILRPIFIHAMFNAVSILGALYL